MGTLPGIVNLLRSVGDVVHELLGDVSDALLGRSSEFSPKGAFFQNVFGS